MVTGKLERGVLKKGDDAIIIGHGKSFKTTVTGTASYYILYMKLRKSCDCFLTSIFILQFLYFVFVSQLRYVQYINALSI